MTENITLPREVVEKARKALTPMAYYTPPYERNEIAAILRTALAAEPTKPSEDIEALRRENERLREALTYDWDQLEACRESLREHMVEIKRLRELLTEAKSYLPEHHPIAESLFPRIDAALRREETT